MSDDNYNDDEPSSGTEETSASEPKSESAGSVKVPEAFQKAATALVQECQTEACLDFLMAECSEKRKSLMSSQKKSGEGSDMMLSDAEMPE